MEVIFFLEENLAHCTLVSVFSQPFILVIWLFTLFYFP
jgi:hypothetical protein